ncbi:MAG: hypothetical protein JSS99_10625 [Actinobacteria bacterium]|nr:hypothetical protein [Actinomycetota bacterium]
MPIRPRLSYANVMSTLAVFLALGGTSYAVARNSIGTRELKDNAVTSRKVRDGAIGRADLARGIVQPGPRGPRGAQGPVGPVGPSEVVQVANEVHVPIPSQAGGQAVPATVTLKPGAWVLEAEASVIYQPPSPGSEWYSCLLRTAAGQTLGRGLERVGTDALGALAGNIAVRGAATFDTPTQVLFLCEHPSTIPGPPAHTESATLTATHVGSVELH